MSLGQAAQSAQPSEPNSSQQASSPDQQQAAAPSQQPASGSNGNAQPTQDQQPAGVGHNGGPDWRAMMAGDDTKAAERLARFQSPTDLWKSYRELEGKMSQRAEPARLPDNATPEQLGEWRKGLGLPEIKDGKPEDYAAAYKIEPPKGYDLTQTEKAMLGDFAKTAYEAGLEPRAVKQATDFFFQQQAAQTQVMNRANVENQKAWQNGLRDELGSKEYEIQLGAANAYLKEMFGDDEAGMQGFLHAQMPGGGKVGDHPQVFKMLAKLALGEGYGDRIIGNTIEAQGGKPLGQQQKEIEGLRFKDKAAYDEAMKPGGKYEQILAARQQRGELDDFGNEVRRRA